MKSFGLLRTNVGLTTNIKIMVDSNYNLSLDSIESRQELSNSKYKKVSFNKNNYWDELISYFYDGLPSDIAYHIQYENDVSLMSSDFQYQYSEIYDYGARNIVNNKNYSEEFEYFAPLHITPGKLPKHFIIFRVDGSGLDSGGRDSLDPKRIKETLFVNFKTIKIFDLGKTTNLGEWLDYNFSNNKYFPITPLEINFNNLEFSYWNGIDYKVGGYTSRSKFLQNVVEEEKEIFELEKYIFDGYKNNSVVYPNILNFSFLFDDSPANSTGFRKWSINRYYGFYLDDLVKVKTVSPYITPPLKDGFYIGTANVIGHSSGDPFVGGFTDAKVFYVEYEGNYYKVEKFTENLGKKLKRVESLNLVVESYVDDIVTKYKIISDVDLSGKQALINKNYARIANPDFLGSNTPNRLINYDNSYFDIPEWNSADVWLIEIDGIFHNLVKERVVDRVTTVISQNPYVQKTYETPNEVIRINSDYTFKVYENDYEYYINEKDPSYKKKVSFIVDKNNQPKKWTIYKLNFTDIKDFDTRIVDTEYSKFEYENKLDLTPTDESKMYLQNLASNTIPKAYDDFIYYDNVVNIPVSSEYTANWETFRLNKGELTELWRKNPTYCRWGFQNSLSANDMPYLLNNSLMFENFNRTADTFLSKPYRPSRNLDYFYTINAENASYMHHSLHVEYNSDYGIYQHIFELDKYLNEGTFSSYLLGPTYSATGVNEYSVGYNYDYFTYFFERPTYFDNGKIKKNVKKYSLFNKGTDSIPNSTLFRGIKFYIYDVEGAKQDQNGKVTNINLKNNNTFEDYKFSILLSKNTHRVDFIDLSNYGTMSKFDNTMTWQIIKEWESGKVYFSNEIVLKDWMLYSSKTDHIKTEPVIDTTDLSQSFPVQESNYKRLLSNIPTAPYNDTTNWRTADSAGTYLSSAGVTNNIFWSPTGIYPGSGVGKDKNIVFNHQDYYIYNPSGTENFWNPLQANFQIDYSNNGAISGGYSTGSVVLFKGVYWYSTIINNCHIPGTIAGEYEVITDDQTVSVNTQRKDFWIATQSSNPNWLPIELWTPNKRYQGVNYVVHDESVYVSTYLGSIPGREPGKNTDWIFQYSLKPLTDLPYSITNNNIINMNDSYYLSTVGIDSPAYSQNTLENGINIYINKKWKNIFINITLSDNTISQNGLLTDLNRDSLYNELNSKLTASNFIQSINDLSNQYGFVDPVNYIIIDESGKPFKYNNTRLQDIPHLITCVVPSPIEMKINSLIYKPINLPRTLRLDTLKFIRRDLSNLNQYNGIPPACEIVENKDRVKPVSLRGLPAIVTNKIYRHSGFYMPVFYDVQIFSKSDWRGEIFNTGRDVSQFFGAIISKNGYLSVPFNSEIGNFKFDTQLTEFGLMKEIKFRKINREGSILKLKNTTNEKSVYPMIDEFGYSFMDFFIFRSTWDYGYHFETVLPQVGVNVEEDLELGQQPGTGIPGIQDGLF